MDVEIKTYRQRQTDRHTHIDRKEDSETNRGKERDIEGKRQAARKNKALPYTTNLVEDMN